MKVALFLTTDVGRGSELLQQVRREHAGADLHVFLRDGDRRTLAAQLAGCRLRRDKPKDGKLTFVRDLRRDRFDMAIVAWHGGAGVQPMRLVALFAGARRTLVYDASGGLRPVRWWMPWTWASDAVRFIAGVSPVTLARCAGQVYRWTVGVCVAGCQLTWFAWRFRRRISP